MTKTAALQAFFSGFGIPAYPANAVPKDTIYPWITYEVITTDFLGGPVSSTVNLWYHTESEAEPNRKADQIGKVLGLGGVTIPCDDGLIWIKKGSPWCQSVTDPDDIGLKRRYLNVTLEYLTN
ncbi:MAG: hypothetical protein MJZ26_12245 [Fibrobacter sp.]|nr:hypothetical protein [Fibrobacter sp.]